MYAALADRFGADEVYLLESPAGPTDDCTIAMVGLRPLLTVAVTRGEVSITGADELVERAGSAVRAATDPGPGGTAMLRRADAVWDMLRAIQRSFAAPGSAHEFSFGFLAFLGYDAVRYIERLPLLIEQAAELPDICLVLHQGFVRLDLAGGTAELVVHQSPAWPWLDPAEVAAVLDQAAAAAPGEEPPPSSVSDSTTSPAYEDDVRRCLAHIAVGDIYQVQIGHELTIETAADPVQVYHRLRRRNPSPYMYLATLAGRRVVGASPELFVRVDRGLATMRPIAGTLPRKGAPDAELARRLRADPKEIAEHMMLVDLCRNDIGRICRAGTLNVPEMFSVEKYSHVLHMVSTVTGALDDGVDSLDVVTALFPSGTMTGAPKIRAMEIIESVESSRRGLYAGALGLIDVGGYLNLALCIRMLVHDGGQYRTRASAGVVADSDPAREWAETRAKLSAAYWAVTGEEYQA
jgi:anthranilate synthase component 1